MRVVIGSDHAGFELKESVSQHVSSLGHEVIDIGVHTPDPADYPDVAVSAGEVLLSGKADRGILICGSGIGVSIAANKIHGIYAGLCENTYSAHQGVEHDAMNVLVLAARVTGTAVAMEIVTAFLGATFSAEERHERRVGKIRAIEEGQR